LILKKHTKTSSLMLEHGIDFVNPKWIYCHDMPFVSITYKIITN